MNRRSFLRFIGLGGLAAGAAKVLPKIETPEKVAPVAPDPQPVVPYQPYTPLYPSWWPYDDTWDSTGNISGRYYIISTTSNTTLTNWPTSS